MLTNFALPIFKFITVYKYSYIVAITYIIQREKIEEKEIKGIKILVKINQQKLIKLSFITQR